MCEGERVCVLELSVFALERGEFALPPPPRSATPRRPRLKLRVREALLRIRLVPRLSTYACVKLSWPSGSSQRLSGITRVWS